MIHRVDEPQSNGSYPNFKKFWPFNKTGVIWAAYASFSSIVDLLSAFQSLIKVTVMTKAVVMHAS